ncbi:hypothetical protein TRFO_36466 [Tritrichomonas foetus]|uniref:Vps16 N-terminal domain-containing protein n=1 Tax=Tritrichomonas foetus TaxID=1144522 RepID=A0A1J4JF97_9EUKA|nr:hypothetical protein TRFO_36466 [Tritrichomonas foetus]|eukprot:OHS97345.1 hypothetical protein TRFO_36466 [Tritrichomonas foetus]
MLTNFTLLVFTPVGVLTLFSVFDRENPNKISPESKPKIVHLVEYSLAIITTHESFLYIPDIRCPTWHSFILSYYRSIHQNDANLQNSNDTKNHQNANNNSTPELKTKNKSKQDSHQKSMKNIKENSQNNQKTTIYTNNENEYEISPSVFHSHDFSFIPICDSKYPFLFCTTENGELLIIHGKNVRKLSDKDYIILTSCVSEDFKNVALLAKSSVNDEFFVIFTDRVLSQFSIVPLSKHKEISSHFLSKVASLNFSDVCWCGNNSLLISYSEHVLFVHNLASIKIIKNVDSPFVIIPEIDGARIISGNGNNEGGHNIFISTVPDEMINLFITKKSRTYLICSKYLEWTKGKFIEGKSMIDLDRHNLDLRKNTEEIIKCTSFVTEKYFQQIFLGAAWFGMSFLDSLHRLPSEENKKILNAPLEIRLLHFLRDKDDAFTDDIFNIPESATITPDTKTGNTAQKKLGNNTPSVVVSNDEIKKYATNIRKLMLITREEMNHLSGDVLILRLCNRGDYISAFIMAKAMKHEETMIYNHCALASIYQQLRTFSGDEKSAIKTIDECVKGLINLDYAHLAISAFIFGENSINRILCQELLRREKILSRKIKPLLLLGNLKEAIKIAVDDGDQNLINQVIKYAIDHNESSLVSSLYDNALIPQPTPNEDQLALLLFRIRDMKIDAVLSYLFGTFKQGILPNPLVIKELKMKLILLKQIHFRSSLIKYKRLTKLIESKDYKKELERIHAKNLEKKPLSKRNIFPLNLNLNLNSLSKPKDGDLLFKTKSDNNQLKSNSQVKHHQKHTETNNETQNQNISRRKSSTSDKSMQSEQISKSHRKFKKPYTIKSAIENALSEGNIEFADAVAERVELSKSRYTWLKLNYYLRNKAPDETLLKLKDEIKLIDGLWAVRRCVLLRRLNVAAAFSESILDPKERIMAQNEIHITIAQTSEIPSK